MCSTHTRYTLPTNITTVCCIAGWPGKISAQIDSAKIPNIGPGGLRAPPVHSWPLLLRTISLYLFLSFYYRCLLKFTNIRCSYRYDDMNINSLQIIQMSGIFTEWIDEQ